MATECIFFDESLSQRFAQFAAEYGHRLFEVFSPQEIHELLSAIAREVANPISDPLCRNA